MWATAGTDRFGAALLAAGAWLAAGAAWGGDALPPPQESRGQESRPQDSRGQESRPVPERAALIPNDGSGRPPRMLVYQSLGAMEGIPRGGGAWPRPDAFARIAEAGWDGVEIVATNPKDFAAIDALAAQHKLRVGLRCYPTKPKDLDIPLQAFREIHADYLCSQVFPYPVTTDDALAGLRALFARTRAADVPFFTETHRGRVTQDLWQTAEYCDAMPELALCADLAQYVVAYEIGWGIPKEMQGAIDKIGARAGMIAGRVSNGEQVQIDIGPDAKNPHAQRFAGYWKRIMTAWLKASRPGDLFVFRTDLEPPAYSQVDADGRETSDRWEQSKILKALAIGAWNAAVKDSGIGESR